MANNEHNIPLDTATFIRIRKWYLLALAAIALTVIIAQVLIQLHLKAQSGDSELINVAGRQRAFSQKLVKETLLLKNSNDPTDKKLILSEIEKTLSVWKVSHDGLHLGDASFNLPYEDDPKVQSLFKELEPHHSAMVTAVENILATHEQNINANVQENDLNTLLHNERPFLSIMDQIVNEYDARSNEQLQKLKRKEYWLLAFSLAILLLEIFVIFRPLSIQIKNTIGHLMGKDEESKDQLVKIQSLYDEKERSLKELQELNFVIDNAALFASIRKDGTIVFISKKFLDLLGHDTAPVNKPISEILTIEEGQQSYLKEVLKINRKNVMRNEELQVVTTKGATIWLDMSIVPMHQSTLEQDILILCSDITERKENQLKVQQLTKQNFEERMQQKKVQASQIVEGQEEERKRIAKDIHDGIGQMLTALKFNIESIDIENKDKTREKIAYLKSLTSDLIKGVRTATFNLTPPELSDHGIFPAIHKMTTELSKLTGKTVLFKNKTDANIRFDSLAETNIYRVTQEAVNNAIKYAEANYILVTLNYSYPILSVVIDDDGKGFDDSILGKLPKNNSEGGMGLFFMKERIDYINGRLFINSELGQGTRVTINYKTEENKIANGTE
ncbi:ATP-binding protein [Maribacter sp. 1_MG-2023]|uniref:ATP-binding protein n=1 Tax=Maribacter sp. 1_MG-2023 TaxID=3062677 RepID=UPI0026E34644|nr:ATP-binding protein [Maribacter sp. 1_MG-2023]MDO6471674.1 type IV pili methyl-accepting chemotaxis transducer N-terminal domain-containing protein [Maribacter sp. 1_MG-2023]